MNQPTHALGGSQFGPDGKTKVMFAIDLKTNKLVTMTIAAFDQLMRDGKIENTTDKDIARWFKNRAKDNPNKWQK